jgi:hypothetical protein
MTSYYIVYKWSHSYTMPCWKRKSFAIIIYTLNILSINNIMTCHSIDPPQYHIQIKSLIYDTMLKMPIIRIYIYIYVVIPISGVAIFLDVSRNCLALLHFMANGFLMDDFLEGDLMHYYYLVVKAKSRFDCCNFYIIYASTYVRE